MYKLRNVSYDQQYRSAPGSSMYTSSGSASNWMPVQSFYQQRRRLATKVQQVGKLSQPFVGSTGQIMDEELLVSSRWPSIATWQGLMLRLKAIRNVTVTTWWSMNKIKTELKSLDKSNFTKPEFLKEADQLYLQLNNAIAHGDEQSLRNIVSDKYLKELQPLLESARKTSGKIHWNCEIIKSAMKAAKSITIPSRPKHLQFAQIAVTFTSKQTLYVTKNGVVTGSPEPQTIKENCVFERSLTKSGSTWKVMSKLPL